MNTNHLSGKTAKRMTKATIEKNDEQAGNFYNPLYASLVTTSKKLADRVYLVTFPKETLENWVDLLQKDGINSKQIVLDQIKNILKGTE